LIGKAKNKGWGPHRETRPVCFHACYVCEVLRGVVFLNRVEKRLIGSRGNAQA